ncbi:acyltransferase family protein [Phytohabitans rumicis]|uniref:Acyltransferase n=1 Tax=Phytohabitans rumicis TaxID=1076125 RepID=A0A6V8LE32_9ACTN|nr:acyltransferase [Phytohabitans rumicis]GFJ93061.1 acyltransferase [Phytohabitans rumicis]
MPRLPSLTGLRFAAAFLVFGLHAYSFVPLVDPFARRVAKLLFDAGDLGVSFFFVLSGFVLTWSVKPGRTPWRFWQGRIARVYPAHLIALALAVGSLVVTDRIPPIFWEPLGASALLVHGWYTQDFVYLGINPVAWSLSAEMFFYLCFPLLHAGLRRLRPAYLYAIGAALIAVTWLMPAIATVAVAPEHERWFVYIFPVTRMAEFTLGIVLARLVIVGAWRGPGLRLATGLFLANYLAVGWAPAQTRDTAATIVGTALLIPAAARADLSGARSVWRHPVAVHLGEVSYAFFLVHLLVIVTAVELFEMRGPWAFWPAVGIAAGLLAAAYALAYAVHRFVEVPGMRLLSPSRRSPAAASRG